MNTPEFGEGPIFIDSVKTLEINFKGKMCLASDMIGKTNIFVMGLMQNTKSNNLFQEASDCLTMPWGNRGCKQDASLPSKAGGCLWRDLKNQET